ncbi:hypothetical protein HNQ44_001372 [Planomicrobium koreense]|uniref:Uncharacterized protein n=1 Tax=Planococcus koreensis TaxID=112331 RepID=A0A7W8FSG9_9BACL|nr:hypothetical protein [Planococcus koreensis]
MLKKLRRDNLDDEKDGHGAQNWFYVIRLELLGNADAGLGASHGTEQERNRQRPNDVAGQNIRDGGAETAGESCKARI